MLIEIHWWSLSLVVPHLAVVSWGSSLAAEIGARDWSGAQNLVRKMFDEILVQGLKLA